MLLVVVVKSRFMVFGMQTEPFQSSKSGLVRLGGDDKLPSLPRSSRLIVGNRGSKRPRKMTLCKTTYIAVLVQVLKSVGPIQNWEHACPVCNAGDPNISVSVGISKIDFVTPGDRFAELVEDRRQGRLLKRGELKIETRWA